MFFDTSSFSLPSPIEEWSAQDTLEVSSHNSDNLVGFSSPTNSDSSNVSELPAYEPTDTTVSPFSSPALRRSSRDKHPPLWIMEFVSINVHQNIPYRMSTYLSYDQLFPHYQAFIASSSFDVEPA